MEHPQTILLCCMLLAGVILYTTVLVQLQCSSTPHRIQVHLDNRHAAVGWPGDSVRAHNQSLAAEQDHFVSLKASISAAASDADLRLNMELWLSYAAADAAQQGTQVSGACQRSHGADFVDRFRSSCTVLCGAAADNQPAQSHVDCCAYPVDGGLGLACDARRVILNTTSFMGRPPAEGEPRHEGYLPRGNAGSVQLQCHLRHLEQNKSPEAAVAASSKPAFTEKQLQMEQLPWFKSAVQQVDPATLQERCSNSRGNDVVSHPVMFVTRLDPTNPYHHTQSLVQAFLSLAVFNDSKSLLGLQVILTDHFIRGPFFDIWQRLAHPYQVLTMDDPTLANRQLCFQHSIHAHYVSPGKAFLGYQGIGGATPCPSIVLMAASHWLRYLFREILPEVEQQQYRISNLRATVDSRTLGRPAVHTQVAGNSTGSSSIQSNGSNTNDNSRHSPAQQHRRLNVVWLSRSWFGRAMKAGGGLTGWQASRDLPRNTENAIVKALDLAVLDWNDAACVPPAFGWWQKPHRVPPPTGCKPSNVSFNFRAVELSVEDLHPDQAVLLTRTAVLVGIHGAALTNQMWMRPHRGAVVEFGAGGNFHYSNMAAELGHKHFRLDGPNVEALTNAVKQAMDHVSTKYHALP